MPISSGKNSKTLKLLNFLFLRMDETGYILKSQYDVKRSVGLSDRDFKKAFLYLQELGLLEKVRSGVILIPLEKHDLAEQLLKLYNSPNGVVFNSFISLEAHRLFNSLTDTG